MKTIKGPIVPLATGNVIYQVTLASGMVITNPSAFGPDGETTPPTPVIVGENGQVLTRRGFEDALKRVSRRIQPSPTLS